MTPALSPTADSAPPLADLMRAHTRDLHARAERSGVLAELLRGRGSRRAYALWLRNLLPVYAALEAGLERHAASPTIAPLARPAVYRARALASDLEAIEGRHWAESLPLLPAGACYADAVDRAADGDGARLIPHAYTRYLGDLNGGRILEPLLARSLELGPGMLAFYAYPRIDDLDAFKHAYRAGFDLGSGAVDTDALLDEARRAFELTIALSDEVRDRAAA